MIHVACLIPAYNEATRIAAVLRAVQGHPWISSLLVIDDGSTDGTAATAMGLGAKVLRTPGNLGKTRALAFGLQNIDASHILLLDADLLGLTAADITALLRPVVEGQMQATLSLRGNSPRTWRLIGMDYISGERVIPFALLQNHLSALDTLPRFGFEVFLNHLLIASQTRLQIIRWPNVASPSKAAKRGLLAGIAADAAMICDIFRTISPLQALRQIIAMRRLSA